MLATGRALMTRPRLLLMDEPSMGLAPVLVEAIFDVIKVINQEGTTILLVEQNALMALSIAHRGYVIQTGQNSPAGYGGQFEKQRNGPKSLSGSGISLYVRGGRKTAAPTVLRIYNPSMPTAEIITIGTELLLGETVDTKHPLHRADITWPGRGSVPHPDGWG